MRFLVVLLQTWISLSFVLHALPSTTRASLEASVLEPRAISTELSTCGYLNGDPDKERTADAGFNCRVDTRNGLWGFCPTTVLTASDCGLAAACIDRDTCKQGCGKTGVTDLTTFTCGRNSFCSTAILTFGVDQSYSYLACGSQATIEHYLVSPLAIETTTEQTSSQTSTIVSSSTTSTTSMTSTTAELAENTSTETARNSSQQESTESSSNNLGPIIGGVIGSLGLICATIITIFVLRRRRRIEKMDSPKQDTPKTYWAQNEVKVQDFQGYIQEMPAEQASRRPAELAA
ncbi:hypothetical protein FLONG3_7238 [Fusarium longipes]|uniref:Uncharacterized protein n=1 Tax=Fusarium longipes TaxID=694270 RepID=A0A395SFD5_9HYPO|nr:hypothetical protein FLONG3_7238 [Fusarium longipes]